MWKGKTASMPPRDWVATKLRARASAEKTLAALRARSGLLVVKFSDAGERSSMNCKGTRDQ